jgi:hypothetical protein
MTAATLKRRLVELESKTNDQDNELEVLHVLRERLREAGQLHDDDNLMDGYREPDNADKMTIGELTLHALRWKHRDTK